MKLLAHVEQAGSCNGNLFLEFGQLTVKLTTSVVYSTRFLAMSRVDVVLFPGCGGIMVMNAIYVIDAAPF